VRVYITEEVPEYVDPGAVSLMLNATAHFVGRHIAVPQRINVVAET
jgi:hypothetical protein